MLNEDWLTGWAARLDAAVARALRDVVSTYPFEAGVHRVGPPSPESELAALRDRMPWIPDDLLTLLRRVGPASLPDIANGYFVHPPDVLIRILDHDDGRADRLGEPFVPGVDVVVFAGNGGGDLYALTAKDGGSVYRLREIGYDRGVYHGSVRGITVAGDDLHAFLERFLDAVAAFADGGRITDL